MDIDCISGWANCIILTLKNPTKCKTISLVPRLLHRKTGREPGRFHHVPRDVACVVLCVVLIIELLPTQSDSKYCKTEVKTIVDVVAGVLDVAGTYGSAVLPFKLLVGYDKFSFYPRLVSRSQTLTRSRRSPC